MSAVCIQAFSREEKDHQCSRNHQLAHGKSWMASRGAAAAAGETAYDDDDAYEGELAYTYVDHHEVRGLLSSPLQVTVSSFILHSYISTDSAVILH